MNSNQQKKYRIAIFASGNGSNAERITSYFSSSSIAEVALILTNRADAFVLERAKKLGIPAFCFSKTQFIEGNEIVTLLKKEKIDLIVLAGFLLLIPDILIKNFPESIINIHPALLPKFGGKGMYGNHVHEAVIASQEKESGITIHYVNEKYDEGTYILQKTCQVVCDETPQTLAEKIHVLEHKYFPEAIENLLLQKQENIKTTIL